MARGRQRKREWQPPQVEEIDTAETVLGVLRAHHRGFGFVQPEDQVTYPDDIFIPKHSMMGAVDGDQVRVAVSTRAVSDKGPEGRIVEIVSRGRKRMAGIVYEIKKGHALLYAPLLGKNRTVLVTGGKRKLQEGDRIVVEVVEWGDEGDETVCKLIEVLGHISDPTVDVPASTEEFQLRSVFPKEVLAEAKTFGTRIPSGEIAQRADFRELETVTVDPATAKDFDDAISLEKDANGHYHLKVHIADASFYVKPGSALDKEAVKRCNSVYFPGTCIPMLPEALSNGLCSLKPNTNRLAVTVSMTFDSDGELINHSICRSVIRSKYRFSYEMAKEVLDGKRRSKHKALLSRMVELCGLLKKKRQQRGSIEFALDELVIAVDDKGVPSGLVKVEYDITHQMIEEFMLKANEVVARSLGERGLPVTYRIHEEPSEDDMREFAMLANVFGFDISENPGVEELQNLFNEAIHSPFGQHLAVNYIRRMRMAYYSPNNIGHYGLKLDYYCHFTSPIRRYVDITAHRLLFGEISDLETVQQIAKECSEQERIAAKAEGSVRVLKKLRLLQRWEEENPYRQYSAVVTDVKPFGVAFDVTELMLDGFLHISRLTNDYFHYDPKNRALVGSNTSDVFKTGEQMTVMCVDVDLVQLEAEWSIISVDNPSSDRAPKKTFKKSRQRKKKRRK